VCFFFADRRREPAGDSLRTLEVALGGREIAYLHGQVVVVTCVTWILLKGGVSVFDMYWIPIHLRYALDKFPNVSQKAGYVLTWIHVSYTFSQPN
jgi:hypothetical protein